MISTRKISLFAVFVSLFTIFISTQYLVNAETTEGYKPTLFVYFERHTIRESDIVNAEIMISNNADYPLTEVNFVVNQPDFLTLQCEKKTTDCLKLGSIQAHSTISRSLAIESKPEVIIGDYKIAFIVKYKWETKNSSSQPVNGQSFIVAEQPLSVKFLGSDTIAGVPLGIATLILPGLSCLLVLALMGTPWSTKWPLGEKMLYSVLVSIAILTLGSKFFPPNLNPGRAISIDILASLSVIGAGIGLILGVIDKLVRQIYQYFQRQKERQLQISLDDDIYTLLEKMIRLNKNIDSHPKVEIKLKNGERHVGSLAVQQNKQCWLIGWFKIILPTNTEKQPKDTEKIKNKLTLLLKKGKYLDAIKLARNHKFNITAKEEIFYIDQEDLSESSSGREKNQWNQSEVSQLEPQEGQANLPLLEVEA